MKITLSAASLLAFSSLLIAQTPGPPAPAATAVSAQIKQAQQLNSDGKQDEALTILNQVLVDDPKNYEANLNAGMVLDLEGHYNQARNYLLRAFEVAPPERKVQALRTTAVSFAFQCDLKQVANFEQQAYDLQMKDQKFTDAAGTANELARIYLECGNVPDAAKWYQTGYQTALRKTDLSEADRDLWNFRWENAKARLAARDGKPKEAATGVAAAKAILDKGKIPDQQRFYPYLTGYVAFYAGDYKTAIADLEKADQKDPFILVLLAQAYEKMGNQADATKYYHQVLAINTHNPTNAFARPLAQKKLGMGS